ncbi:Dead end protein 1 [Willisornis vidua]|uniref:Dead end protein 1 n=1 Tax=Willisornis vidua TaxID=1566151 RepID=A0ABQ9DXR6_9PASS|nr:Dead end protein 1 [Willisornis vidua]
MESKTWSNSVYQTSKRNLLAWEKETGIKLVQINGQRRYGGPPPGWMGSPPPAGTEVYIGKLPPDVYEDTLIPLFQSVGKLYEFRLMMTFSGLNRGFAYARYCTPQTAQVAIATFNHFQVRRGCAILVCRSIQKRELILDGLAASVSQWELEPTLRRVTKGVLSITLHSSPSERQAMLAVLKYNSHQAATMAKKTLTQGALRLRGLGMRVDWLHHDLKQKLQLWQQRPPSSQLHESKRLAVPKPLALSPVVQSMLDHLNILCWRQRLGTPVLLTKCVRVNPDGWLRFWYHVMIAGYPEPFSGFTWIRKQGQGRSAHEEAKAAVAQRVLHELGRQQT